MTPAPSSSSSQLHDVSRISKAVQGCEKCHTLKKKLHHERRRNAESEEQQQQKIKELQNENEQLKLDSDEMRHAAQVLENENHQLREQMKEFIHSQTMSIIQAQAELHHSLLLKTRGLTRTQTDLDKCMKHKEEMRSEMRRLNRKLKRAQEAKQNEDLNLKFC